MVEGTVKVAVEVPEPGAAMGVGLKPTVTPVGAPDEVSATAALNPPETVVVMVEFPLLPAATVSDVGIGGDGEGRSLRGRSGEGGDQAGRSGCPIR